jgi:hypothetical protein
MLHLSLQKVLWSHSYLYDCAAQKDDAVCNLVKIELSVASTRWVASGSGGRNQRRNCGAAFAQETDHMGEAT